MPRLKYDPSVESFTRPISVPAFTTCAIRWEVDYDSIRPGHGRRAAAKQKLTLKVEAPNREPPSTAQNKAIEFLISNAQTILDAVLRFALREAKVCYYGDSLPPLEACDDGMRQVRKRFDTVDGFRELVGPTTITVLRESSKGVAYVAIDFSTAFDPEHGFSVLTHRAKSLSWAGSGERGGGPPTTAVSDVEAFITAVRELRDALARVRSVASARIEVDNIASSRMRQSESQKKCRGEFTSSKFRDRWRTEYSKCWPEMERIIQDVPEAVPILSPALRGEPTWAALKKKHGRNRKG